MRFVYQHRNGSYDVAIPVTQQVETHLYNGFATVDAGLSYRGKYASPFVEATNIGNTESFDFSGLNLPGRWVKVGVKFDFGTAK